MNISLLTIMALQYLGVEYRWGGNNRDGLDCSGFVLKVLHDVGYTLPDMTAQGLYNHCLKRDGISSKECDALLFFGRNTQNISHVAISLGEIDGVPLMIEAGGAGQESKTMSREDLLRIDAAVRIKPISNRSDLVAGFKIPLKERL